MAGGSPQTRQAQARNSPPKAGSGGGATRLRVGYGASSEYPEGKPAPAGAAIGGGSRHRSASRPTHCPAMVTEAVAPAEGCTPVQPVGGGGHSPGAPLLAATLVQPEANPLAGVGWVVQTQCAAPECREEAQAFANEALHKGSRQERAHPTRRATPDAVAMPARAGREGKQKLATTASSRCRMLFRPSGCRVAARHSVLVFGRSGGRRTPRSPPTNNVPPIMTTFATGIR